MNYQIMNADNKTKISRHSTLAATLAESRRLEKVLKIKTSVLSATGEVVK